MHIKIYAFIDVRMTQIVRVTVDLNFPNFHQCCVAGTKKLS